MIDYGGNGNGEPAAVVGEVNRRFTAASSQPTNWKGGRSLVNTDVLWPDRELAESQVLRIQIKLHQWDR